MHSRHAMWWHGSITICLPPGVLHMEQSPAHGFRAPAACRGAFRVGPAPSAASPPSAAAEVLRLRRLPDTAGGSKACPSELPGVLAAPAAAACSPASCASFAARNRSRYSFCRSAAVVLLGKASAGRPGQSAHQRTSVSLGRRNFCGFSEPQAAQRFLLRRLTGGCAAVDVLARVPPPAWFCCLCGARRVV
mmetsp:Transcript_36097/g.92266  ORF Transcript_36097/g.92266 Transcript_36097/m.92266 type:complete len:191 (-) Transcript_36097:526-1098(-)